MSASSESTPMEDAELRLATLNALEVALLIAICQGIKYKNRRKALGLTQDEHENALVNLYIKLGVSREQHPRLKNEEIKSKYCDLLLSMLNRTEGEGFSEKMTNWPPPVVSSAGAIVVPPPPPPPPHERERKLWIEAIRREATDEVALSHSRPDPVVVWPPVPPILPRRIPVSQILVAALISVLALVTTYYLARSVPEVISQVQIQVQTQIVVVTSTAGPGTNRPPATVPPAPTETPSPTPTSTFPPPTDTSVPPTPAITLPFEDDFDSGLDQWNFVDNMGTLDGRLIPLSGGTGYVQVGDNSMRNFSIEFQYTNYVPAAGVGMWIHMGNVRLSINPGSSRWERLNPQDNQWKFLSPAPTGADRNAMFKIVVSDSSLTVYRNGQEWTTADFGEEVTGPVGITLKRDLASLDWIKVTSP